ARHTVVDGVMVEGGGIEYGFDDVGGIVSRAFKPVPHKISLMIFQADLLVVGSGPVAEDATGPLVFWQGSYFTVKSLYMPSMKCGFPVLGSGTKQMVTYSPATR